jgi:uncharacterized cupin superfamily protein
MIRVDPSVALAPMEQQDTSRYIGDVPTQHFHVHFADPTGQMLVGVWETTDMHTKSLPFPRNKFTCLLEGSVTITDGTGVALFSEVREYTSPRGYNLLNDPREGQNVLFPNTWVAKAALPQLERHVASLKPNRRSRPGRRIHTSRRSDGRIRSSMRANGPALGRFRAGDATAGLGRRSPTSSRTSNLFDGSTVRQTH